MELMSVPSHCQVVRKSPKKAAVPALACVCLFVMVSKPPAKVGMPFTAREFPPQTLTVPSFSSSHQSYRRFSQVEDVRSIAAEEVLIMQIFLSQVGSNLSKFTEIVSEISAFYIALTLIKHKHLFLQKVACRKCYSTQK